MLIRQAEPEATMLVAEVLTSAAADLGQRGEALWDLPEVSEAAIKEHVRAGLYFLARDDDGAVGVFASSLKIGTSGLKFLRDPRHFFEDAGVELNEIESLVMKTLYLMRHAKSSRNDPSLPDRERPLDDRGRHDAPKMGKRLTKRGVKPDLLVSSPALRALTTAQLIADELGYQRKDIVVDERLYASSRDDLLAVIYALDDKLDRVMLFGHNPEFSDLAHRLWGEIIGMPTCAVAEFRFDAKAWADIGEIGPAQVKLDAPKK